MYCQVRIHFITAYLIPPTFASYLSPLSGRRRWLIGCPASGRQTTILSILLILSDKLFVKTFVTFLLPATPVSLYSIFYPLTHRLFSAGMTIEVVMVEKAQEAERRRPVRVSRGQHFLRIEGEAVSLVHSYGPRRRIIDDALQAQAGMEWIFFEKAQGFCYLLHDRRLTAKALRILDKLLSRYQFRHGSSHQPARPAFPPRRFLSLPSVSRAPAR